MHFTSRSRNTRQSTLPSPGLGTLEPSLDNSVGSHLCKWARILHQLKPEAHSASYFSLVNRF